MKRLLWFVLVLPVFPALGAEWKRPSVLPPASFADHRITLEEAVARVQEKHGGRVVAAAPVRREGKTKYRIRIDVEGRVKTFFVDEQGRIANQ